MRKIITTCIFAGIALVQASEPQRVLADQPKKETVVAKDELKGQMSVPPPENNGVCEAPYTAAADQELVEKALEACYPGVKKIPDRYYANAQKLLKIETELCIPGFMRGMTLAAACIESGFDEKAEGDHKFSKDGKTPKAIGILQMWPYYEVAYKTNRRDVESAARGWLKHIKAQVPSVQRRCKTISDTDTWRLAWVHGVRGPKKGGRCGENVSHWRLFMKIRGLVSKLHT